MDWPEEPVGRLIDRFHSSTARRCVERDEVVHGIRGALAGA